MPIIEKKKTNVNKRFSGRTNDNEGEFVSFESFSDRPCCPIWLAFRVVFFCVCVQLVLFFPAHSVPFFSITRMVESDGEVIHVD